MITYPAILALIFVVASLWGFYNLLQIVEAARIKREIDLIRREIQPPKSVYPNIDYSRVRPSNGDAHRHNLVATRINSRIH